ncbi:uncharacterized protein J8A68_004259 [[Candida] subhashii]|uniref:Flavoprotein domain-containing protein n=1 Tax=[Candida] subhashii TaxID=561895 RepID=A0A8J5Q6P1_9ASCO|nr:uncharacterized protein J8A68_004259 [[Candida] subhashii]KAG7662249.1 hypothetical protein J8A68_004259 [[Candida] subhashii]
MAKEPSLVSIKSSSSTTTFPPVQTPIFQNPTNQRQQLKLKSPTILTNKIITTTTNLLQSPITPIQSMASPITNQLKHASVSFNDLEERTRRFTISAQPSAVNVGTQENMPPPPPSQPHPQQPSSNQPSRHTSINRGRNESVNDVLTFMANPSTIPQHVKTSHLQSLQTGSNTTRSRDSTASPTTPEIGLKKGYTFEPEVQPMVNRISPSPPPPASVTSPYNPSNISITQPIKINALPPSANSSRRSSIKRSNKTIVASPVGPPVPFQQYLSKEDDGKFHILLACTGSVATIKMPLIIDKLFQIFGTSRISIQLVVTKSASHFLKGLKIHNDVKIWRDEDEWANYNEASTTITASTTQNPGPTNMNITSSNNTTTATTTTTINKKPKNPYDRLILHNELRKWADIMLLAPLSANTLAKIANGISDNLLTSIIRSWGPPGSQQSVKKPIIVAPAMNTFMYTHPITAKQLAIIMSPDFGIEVLKPVEKVLVCGDIGMGGMREWTEVVDILRRKIVAIKAEKKKLDGEIAEDGENENDDDEENEEDEENDEDDDEDDDDDDDDDEDDDEDDEEEEDAEIETPKVSNGNSEHKTNNVTENRKGNVSAPNENDNEEMIFDITDDEQDGDSTNTGIIPSSPSPSPSHQQQKITIPKETKNII